ncbi:MAG: F0F1 ATP synthase subunit delta [Actinobacteria bacterium]|nr:F0F1 ATP synthase subunit delta [Actinomycetota bacterium]
MEEIARIYAQSLYQAAEGRGKVDSIKQQLDQFADAVEGSEQLSLLLFSPYFSGAEKSEALDRVIEGAEPEFLNFLKLLAEKHRLPAIQRIRAGYEALWAEYHKLLPVTVTSAVALPQETIDKIGTSVEQQTGRKVELTGKVDKEIIGGLVLQVGNMVLDASIHGRLERLRKQVTAAAA